MATMMAMSARARAKQSMRAEARVKERFGFAASSARLLAALRAR
jgi:hypothetical protein